MIFKIGSKSRKGTVTATAPAATAQDFAPPRGASSCALGDLGASRGILLRALLNVVLSRYTHRDQNSGTETNTLFGLGQVGVSFSGWRTRKLRPRV